MTHSSPILFSSFHSFYFSSFDWAIDQIWFLTGSLESLFGRCTSYQGTLNKSFQEITFNAPLTHPHLRETFKFFYICEMCTKEFDHLYFSFIRYVIVHKRVWAPILPPSWKHPGTQKNLETIHVEAKIQDYLCEATISGIASRQSVVIWVYWLFIQSRINKLTNPTTHILFKGHVKSWIWWILWTSYVSLLSHSSTSL